MFECLWKADVMAFLAGVEVNFLALSRLETMETHDRKINIMQYNFRFRRIVAHNKIIPVYSMEYLPYEYICHTKRAHICLCWPYFLYLLSKTTIFCIILKFAPNVVNHLQILLTGAETSGCRVHLLVKCYSILLTIFDV